MIRSSAFSTRAQRSIRGHDRPWQSSAVGRPAFGRWELVVAVVVVTILGGLLTPAIQSAREAARRRACQQNLKQIAGAIANYYDAFHCFPPGLPNGTNPPAGDEAFSILEGSTARGFCQGPNWAVAILPYEDQQALFDGVATCNEHMYNSCSDCSAPAPAGLGVTWTPVGTLGTAAAPGMGTPSGFLCPSGLSVMASVNLSAANMPIAGQPNTLTKGNYAACFGSYTFYVPSTTVEIYLGADLPNGSSPAVKTDSTYGKATFSPEMVAGAFGIVDVRRLNPETPVQSVHEISLPGKWKLGSQAGVNMKSITDGTRYTLLIAEIVSVDSANDGRGVWVWPAMGASAFTTMTPPNSATSEYVPLCDASTGGQGPTCITDTTIHASATTRSRHSGSVVNVAMCDGSIHTITADIDPAFWMFLGSRAGGQPAPRGPSERTSFDSCDRD